MAPLQFSAAFFPSLFIITSHPQLRTSTATSTAILLYLECFNTHTSPANRQLLCYLLYYSSFSFVSALSFSPISTLSVTFTPHHHASPTPPPLLMAQSSDRRSPSGMFKCTTKPYLYLSAFFCFLFLGLFGLFGFLLFGGCFLDFFGEYSYRGVRSLAFGVRRFLLSLPPSSLYLFY